MENTELWIKANEIYTEISELSVKQALARLDELINVPSEVKEAVHTLINIGSSEVTHFFQKKISPLFNNGIEPIYRAGQVLDEYELLEELGQGGMAQVFKAQRTHTETQRFVAIKIFSPRFNSQELLNHFINEQKILSGLSHPHIVKMLHGGKTQDNTVYLVMELIEEALPINEYCKNNELSHREVIKLMTQCADALAYSHANLIIHRDLKPDNILINNDRELKIVDFGIAKLMTKDISGNETTIMALTPSYAAPEQINAEHISVETDVFSLAVVALSLLIDDDPLPKDRLIKSCTNDEAHIDAALKKATIDKDLKNIFTKALAQKPSNRYSSMQAFSDDLNNWLDNKPVNATSQSLIYRLQKFAKRRSALFATMVTFLFFLMIGSVLGYQQYKQIKIEAEKASQVKQFMLDAFEQTDPNLSKGLKITAENILDSANDKINNDIDPEIRFELLQTIGESYWKIGYPKKATHNLNQSLQIKPHDSRSTVLLLETLFNSEQYEALNKQFDQLNIEDLDSIKDQSIAYRMKGKMMLKDSDFSKAEILLNKSLALAEQVKHPKTIQQAKSDLAYLYHSQSNTDKAIELLEQTISENNNTPTDTTVMKLKSELGRYYHHTGQYQKSIAVLSVLEQQQRTILGNQHPSLALTLNQMADTNEALGQLETARKLSEESYQIYSARYGENSVKTASVLNSLAILHYRNGDIKKSIQLMYDVLKVYEKIHNSGYIDTLEVKTNLAALLSHDGRNEEAAQIAREVYVSRLEKLGPLHESTLYTQCILALSLAKSSHLDEAEELAALANKNALESQGKTHPITAETYSTLVKVYKLNNNYQAGIDIIKIMIADGLHKPSSPRYYTILIDMAELYQLNNDNDNAQVYYLKAIENSMTVFNENHKQVIRVRLKYAKFLHSINKISAFSDQMTVIANILEQEKITDENVISEYQKLKSLMDEKYH